MTTVFSPGSIGNVGPGFDVLGLAVEGIGDRVTVELTDRASRIERVCGRDADLVPADPSRNSAAIAAIAWLRAHGDSRNVVMTIEKGLPLSGGLGGSAASSVAGAYAAYLASANRVGEAFQPVPRSHEKRQAGKPVLHRWPGTPHTRRPRCSPRFRLNLRRAAAPSRST